LFINSITFYNFRNLTNQSISLFPTVNFIIGLNGHGKTNIVEAIYCLSRGKSFRTSRTTELVQESSNEASVFAKVIRKDTNLTLGFAIKDKSRQFFIDHENKSSVRELLGKLISVSFTPSDIALIKGAPSERRAFIDKHIMDSKGSFIETIMTYQRALKHKALILRQGRCRPQELSPWNTILSESGALILRERESFLNRLKPLAEKYYQRFTNETTSLDLTLHGGGANKEELYNSEKFMNILEQNAQKEISNKTATIGPHRQDILFNIDDKNSRAYSSQGESRSLVLALKLGALEMIEEDIGESPVVLLDDVDSELDVHRRDALLEMIFSKERQVLVTATHVRNNELKEYGKYSIFEVSRGTIKEKKDLSC